MLIIRNALDYDDLLTREFMSGNFLQSSIWKDFLTAQKKKYWQLIIADNLDRTLAICLLQENKLVFGKSYLYAPKGPIFVTNDLKIADKQDALQLLLSQIRDITIATERREELFCKLELVEDIPSPPQLIKTQDVQPAHTWVLDLNKEVKGLLGQMHTKTRYNIALAQRKGVKVVVSTKQEDLKHFLKLLSGTAKRQGIKFHSNKYYQILWQILLKHKVGKLYLAEVNNKVVAANMVITFGKAMTYLHGVSDYNNRQFMAPYLLQWQAIKNAKEQGVVVYDFWGVTNIKDEPKSWQGITRFKKGFGGRLISSPGAQSFIYNKKWYSWYLLAKRLRKIF